MTITATTNGDATSAFQAALGAVGYPNNALDGLAQVQLAVANMLATPRAVATTITSTTAATQRLTESTITITPTTTFSITAGGSLAGVRGAVILSASKSFTDGFLYGVQGKITNSGIMAEASAARYAAVLGQVDLASGTITAGQVSCLWGDFQGASPTLTDPSQINALRLTNSSTNGTINAMIFCYGAATYFAQIGAASGPAYFIATAPSSLAKSLKILVGSTTYYIPLYSAAS